jgi:hypothetical protein
VKAGIQRVCDNFEVTQEYREYVSMRGKAGIQRVCDNLEGRHKYREYVTIWREGRNTESR